MLSDEKGRVNISIVLTGFLGLAGLLFILYVWSNMPQSGIENPAIGDPLLLAGVGVVVILLIVYLIKKAR